MREGNNEGERSKSKRSSCTVRFLGRRSRKKKDSVIIEFWSFSLRSSRWRGTNWLSSKLLVSFLGTLAFTTRTTSVVESYFNQSFLVVQKRARQARCEDRDSRMIRDFNGIFEKRNRFLEFWWNKFHCNGSQSHLYESKDCGLVSSQTTIMNRGRQFVGSKPGSRLI